MTITKFFAALALCVMMLAATPPVANAQHAHDLSGVWQGVYWGGGNEPTSFQLTMRDDPGPGISGSIVENNFFGDMSSPFLLATFSGRTSGANVTFEKAYDGTAGVSHAVRYQGQLLSNGRRIAGTWEVDGLSGQFEIAR